MYSRDVSRKSDVSQELGKEVKDLYCQTPNRVYILVKDPVGLLKKKKPKTGGLEMRNNRIT